MIDKHVRKGILLRIIGDCPDEGGDETPRKTC